MDIKNIIIDFDNTLANSSVAAIEYIQNKYSIKDSVPYDPSALLWGFEPFITDKEQVKEALEYMNSEEFFKKVDLMENAKKTLYYLKKEAPLVGITLCTNRTGKSFDLVKKWLKEYDLDQFFNYLICVSSFDKSVINGEVIIDDKPTCMLMDQRPYHIVFGDYRYSRDEFINNYVSLKEAAKTYRFCKNWDEVLPVLLELCAGHTTDF